MSLLVNERVPEGICSLVCQRTSEIFPQEVLLYGQYENFIKHYEVPLFQMLYGILGHDHIQWHSPFIRLFTKLWPCYQTGSDLITIFGVLTLFREVSKGHLYSVRLTNRERLLLRTPGPVRYGTLICSNDETIHPWTCRAYGTFEFRTTHGTSILLHWYSTQGKLEDADKMYWYCLFNSGDLCSCVKTFGLFSLKSLSQTSLRNKCM